MTRSFAHADELIARIGAFLAALTGNQAPDSVQAEIMRRLSEPDSDRRLAGVARTSQQFEAAWTALARGQGESEELWRSVILPTVVAYSSPQNSKNHLELVTNLWLVARAALDEPDEDEEEEDDALAVTARSSTRPQKVPATAKDLAAISHMPAGSGAHRSQRKRRGAVVAVVLTVIVVVAAALWWQRDRQATGPAVSGDPIATSGTLPNGTLSPATTASAAPSMPAAGATEPAPLSANVPAPAPTWTGPGPASPPTAPQSLTATNVGTHTAALQWQPPVDPGTGGVAYYRILRDGADIGWTTQSAVTVTALTPATSYVFTVVAYNGAGLASPPSQPLTVTTASPPATGPPPAATTASLATTPASPIALGQSFIVNGSGWPCPGVTVEVSLTGRVVAAGTVDSEGRFTAPVAVEPIDASTAKVSVVGGGPDLVVRQGEWRLEARPVDPPACGNAITAIRVTFG